MEALFWAAFGLLAGTLIPLTGAVKRRLHRSTVERKRISALQAELAATTAVLAKTQERVAQLEGVVERSALPRPPSS